jgi:hypothetical protein
MTEGEEERARLPLHPLDVLTDQHDLRPSSRPRQLPCPPVEEVVQMGSKVATLALWVLAGGLVVLAGLTISLIVIVSRAQG